MTDTALSGRLFVKMSFSPVIKGKNAIRLNHTTPGLAGRFTGRRLIISDGERHSGSACAAQYLCCKTIFLQWLHKRSNPRLVVNLCFIVVLIFSTLLTGAKLWYWKMPISPVSVTIWKRLPVRWTDNSSSASIKCCFFATACVMRWKRRWRLACYMMR